MSKKAIYPGIKVWSDSAIVTFGNGLVGTGVYETAVELVSLTKPGKIGTDTSRKNEGKEYIILNFCNEKSLDVLMDALKVVKKEFRKRKRK